MSTFQIHDLHPCSKAKEFLIKIAALKTLMYSNHFWGLYKNGWAMTLDHEDFIFPFWLNQFQAHQYAKTYWPNYQPRLISQQNFNHFLLPTLKRLNITPTLCSHQRIKMKLNNVLMQKIFLTHNQNKLRNP